MKTKYYILTSLVLLFTALALCFCGCDAPAESTSAAPGETSTLQSTVASTTTAATTTVAATTTTGKRIALTFDDGPHNSYTKWIVDELSKYGYNATFFVVGNRVDGSEYNGSSALRYAYEAGNEIGIHGYTHLKYYSSCSDSDYAYELSKTAQAIRAVISDYPIYLMRPVGGFITDARVAECEYSVIMWNVDSEDWKYKYKSGDSEAVAAEKVATIVENVMSTVREGGIILMHDIYESTYDAVKIILERLHAEGYEVVTVSELLGDSLAAGKKYSSRYK